MYEVNEQLVEQARERIRRERWYNVRLVIKAAPGVSLAGARVTVTLTRHAFRFGCNGFGLTTIADRGLGRAYEERFAALLNYATLPFYWGSYEPQRGVTRESALRQMAAFCQERHIATKGHPLAWHEVFPAWAQQLDDAEVLDALRQRVRALVSGFRGLVDTWDVVNEATVSARYDNAVGRWAAQKGAAPMVAELLRIAHIANPQAELLYNDFNLRAPEYRALVQALVDAQAPLHALGLQSHMHVQTWPLEETWKLCENYARWGLPLHFTELTILSGRAKDPNDKDWHTVHTDWPTTPEGEAGQLRYGEALYTLLYSHPAVEAITWWDFSDHQAWQGAPAGLLRADMSPKPLYERLQQLIWGEWATHAQGIIGQDETFVARCAAGEHQVEVITPSGDKLSGTFSLAKGENPAKTVCVS
jgi:endo-1,4-beta-xylanase